MTIQIEIPEVKINKQVTAINMSYNWLIIQFNQFYTLCCNGIMIKNPSCLNDVKTALNNDYLFNNKKDCLNYIISKELNK